MSTNYPPPPPEEPGIGGTPPTGDGTPPPPEAYPPASGYPPPPPEGNYPPPPPVGGGYAPPPPGMAGYGVGQPPYSIGAAFNWGWKKFQENAATVVLAVLIYLVVLVGVQVIWTFMLQGIFLDDASVTINRETGAVSTDGGSGFVVRMFVSAIGTFLFFVLQTIMQAGIVRGATEITHGRKPELPMLFSTENLGQVLGAALLVGLATAIGVFLCFFPALIVLFYTQFTMFFVVERRLGAIDAIKASASLVNKNVGVLVGFFLVSLLAYFLGALACIVGLLVAFPVVFLAQAYTYRTLQGEVVAP